MGNSKRIILGRTITYLLGYAVLFSRLSREQFGCLLVSQGSKVRRRQEADSHHG